jgi:hypothetical protein
LTAVQYHNGRLIALHKPFLQFSQPSYYNNLENVYSVTLLGTCSTVPIEIRHWRCKVFRMSLSIYYTVGSPRNLATDLKSTIIDISEMATYRLCSRGGDSNALTNYTLWENCEKTWTGF